MVHEELIETGLNVGFRTFIVIGFYLTVFFLLDQTAWLSVDIGGFLDQYGLLFLLATAVIQTANVLIISRLG